MKILISNNHLDTIGGSETFTFALIAEIKRRGHEVEYFTFRRGIVSELIEKELNVKYMASNRYDLILANHNSTVAALWEFGLIIQTCHGIFPYIEQPSIYADGYVAISEEVQKHLALKEIPSIIIHNGIDLVRFSPKKEVNKNLKRIASFCQSDVANEKVEAACKILDIEYIRVDKFKDTIWSIEDLINDVDLVVGLGRSAYDAIACGRPVVVFDERSYLSNMADGYLTPIIGSSIKFNCSGRCYQDAYDVQDLVQEFLKYNPKDSFELRKFAETNLDIVKNVDEYMKFYTVLATKKVKQNLKREIRNWDSLLNTRLFKKVYSRVSKNNIF